LSLTFCSYAENLICVSLCCFTVVDYRVGWSEFNCAFTQNSNRILHAPSSIIRHFMSAAAGGRHNRLVIQFSLIATNPDHSKHLRLPENRTQISFCVIDWRLYKITRKEIGHKRARENSAKYRKLTKYVEISRVRLVTVQIFFYRATLCYSAVYAVVVCLCVCRSHAGFYQNG